MVFFFLDFLERRQNFTCYLSILKTHELWNGSNRLIKKAEVINSYIFVLLGKFWKAAASYFSECRFLLQNLAKFFSPCFSRELNRAWQLSSSASSPRLNTTTSSTASAHAMTDPVHIPAHTGETHTCGAAPHVHKRCVHASRYAHSPG